MSKWIIRSATVREQREYGTDPFMQIKLEEAAGMLADSAFMRPHVIELITAALEAGRTFTLYRRPSGLEVSPEADEASEMASYRLAKAEDFALFGMGGASSPPKKPESADVPADPTGSSPKKVRDKGLGVRYAFAIPPKGEERIVAFNELTKQGRAILQVFADFWDSTDPEGTSPREMNFAMIVELLRSAHEKCGVDVNVDLAGKFKAHFGWTYEPLGLVKKVEEAE